MSSHANQADGGPQLTAGQAARILQVSRKTVSRWADKGLIPCLVTLGGHRRFRRSALEVIQREMDRSDPEWQPHDGSAGPAADG